MNQIKTRLLLMLLPLLLSIFLLGIYTFFEKYKQYETLDNSCKTIALSIKISNLIHALQLERGISSSYIESFNPKYINLMKNKREYTDIKYMSLMQSISKKSNNLSGIKKSTESLYNQLNIFRINIDKKNKNKIFKSYSSVISEYLQLISHLSYSIQNKSLIREYNAYLTLLWLQESAAKERGILCTAFEVNKIDAKKHMLFSEYNNKFDQLLDNFNSIAPEQYKKELASVLKKEEVKNVDSLDLIKKTGV